MAAPETTSDPLDPIQRLLSQAHRGTPEDLGREIEGCRSYLHQIARTQVPADLEPIASPSDFVQDAMMEAYNGLDRFRGGDRPRLKAWLRKILTHNIQNFVRRYRGTRKRDVGREVPLDGTPSRPGAAAWVADDGTSPSSGAARNEMGDLLRSALDRLPERDRRVIAWRSFDQLTFEEIGARLGVTKARAHALHERALARLQEAFRSLSAA